MCLYKMIDERKPTIPRMMTAINFSEFENYQFIKSRS